MKRISGMLAALLLAACATPVDPEIAYRSYIEKMHVSVESDGERVASSAPSVEAKYPTAFVSGGSGIAMWVMAYKPLNGPTRVILAGSRAFQITTDAEASANDPKGPWDRPDPAFVGLPWREADFHFTERETVCYRPGYGCQRLQQFEVRLTATDVKALIDEKAESEIAIALFTKRNVDWRLPRLELVAALDAVGATAEFR